MEDQTFDNIEIAPPSAVLAAARDFAAALADMPQFKAFEDIAERFRHNLMAQQAMSAYQEKQKAWRALIMLNALSPEQSTELESLKNAFFDQPVVQEYLKAQTDLTTLCQALGDMLSEPVGLNYAAACGVSCCG
ncbi:MAG TPA: YlbF family regulator [Anaerolineales bacterium]|nr:YlbF family regulator [Anaerolineales bacterium]